MLLCLEATKVRLLKSLIKHIVYNNLLHLITKKLHVYASTAENNIKSFQMFHLTANN